MTDGLDVLVQLVIEAMTTAPWSSTNSPRDSERTVVGFDGRPSQPLGGGERHGGFSSAPLPGAGGSLAGKDSAFASSMPTGAPSGSSA